MKMKDGQKYKYAYFEYIHLLGVLIIAPVFFLKELNIFFKILLIIIGFSCRAIQGYWLCPRCKMPIMQAHYSVGLVTDAPQHCLRCGRDRSDVLPFQYLRKPEPWDGKYHDEGGGEQQEYYGWK